MGLSFQTNFESVQTGVTGGLDYSFGATKTRHGFSGSLIGVSLSSTGGKPSLSLGGLTSSVSNSNGNRVSTSSHGFHIDIPVWYGINVSLGYSKQRYWTDESTNITTWGSLTNLGSGNPNNNNQIEISSKMLNPNQKLADLPLKVILPTLFLPRRRSLSKPAPKSSPTTSQSPAIPPKSNPRWAKAQARPHGRLHLPALAATG